MRNFVPDLWIFLPEAFTPPRHDLLLIDSNAQAMNEKDVARLAREQQLELEEIGRRLE